jgi:hypothetical protein
MNIVCGLGLAVASSRSGAALMMFTLGIVPKTYLYLSFQIAGFSAEPVIIGTLYLSMIGPHARVAELA